ncbi:MAG: UPF0182 family protein [Candidatus Bathyarchaeia archaeon]
MFGRYHGRGRRVPLPKGSYWIPLALALILALWISWDAILRAWLDAIEFGDLFLRPLYFSLYGGIALASIAFFRIDFLRRRSLTWWAINFVSRLRRSWEEGGGLWLDLDSFSLPFHRFLAWQITKVLIGALFLQDPIFGMALVSALRGWDFGLAGLLSLLKLPFLTPPPDPRYSLGEVIPLIPALTLLVGPILRGLGLRLLLLVGITNLARALMHRAFPIEAKLARAIDRASILWGIGALLCLWIALKLFIASYIDYNTKFLISGFLAAGIYLGVLSLRGRAPKAWRTRTIRPRRISRELIPLALIALLTSSIVIANNSIADAKKVDWLGPYTAQEICVNRYLAELDEVLEIPYNFSSPPSPVMAPSADDVSLLRSVRLWDWEAAYAKLKPEIGLMPYLDFQDSDILRFGGRLYWAASMKLVLPETVKREDRWYAMHFFYTHVPNGFFLLDAHDGRIVNASLFFKQRMIYYGEGGLFKDSWAAYPLGRGRSDELGGALYSGKGGIDLNPPLSWLFEFNFLLAYGNTPIHVMRHRDIHERMRLLFPYFEYEPWGARIDAFPVTDGENTYFAIPLLVKLDTGAVPWSKGNPMVRLVGYGLIDVYNGDIKLYVLGRDFFSQIFKMAYGDYASSEIPDWLKPQMRYPEELFEWRVAMYNYYHVTDPASFIVGKEFYEVPEGLDTYYVMAKPPGFKEPTFLGLLSLELRGARGRNLAGYMVVQNDYGSFGRMIFYKVPMESKAKLLGPSGALEALEKNPSFVQLRTLLRSPRIGNIILYRIGSHDVYFIPVYTAGTGGVVAELGVIAAVGASFTGEYYVGLGSTPEEAFAEYLKQFQGAGRATIMKPEAKISSILKFFEGLGIKVVTPSAIYPHVSFKEGDARYLREGDWNSIEALLKGFVKEWGKGSEKVLMWSEGNKVNFGFLSQAKGIVELHYVSIEV